MLATNPLSETIIDAPVYTYGRNSFLWNGDEFVSGNGLPYNSHKDNQAHLNNYNEKQTTSLDSREDKTTMPKVPMFPSGGFGSHYAEGIGHPIPGMLYPSFYEHYVSESHTENQTNEVYPPYGDLFIPCINDPLASHEDPVVVEEEVAVAETSDIDTDNIAENTAMDEEVQVEVENTGIDTDNNVDKNAIFEEEVDSVVETGDIDSDKTENIDTDGVSDVGNAGIDTNNIDEKKSNELFCSQCDKNFKCTQNKRNHDLHFHSEDAALVTASKAKEQKARVELADQKRFKCSVCPAKFGHKHSRKEHFLRIHADQTDPMVIEFKTQENAKRRKIRG